MIFSLPLQPKNASTSAVVCKWLLTHLEQGKILAFREEPVSIHEIACSLYKITASFSRSLYIPFIYLSA